MQSIDSINLQIRPNLIYTEGGAPSLRIYPEEGKALNLREGQVINSVIALRQEGQTLSLAGRNIQVPPNFGSPGEAVSLRVSQLRGVWLLTKLSTVHGAGRAQGAFVSSKTPAQIRFLRLLEQSRFYNIAKFFDKRFLSHLGKSTELQGPLIKLNHSLISAAVLDGNQLKGLVENTGLASESMLRNGRMTANFNLKSLLIELRKKLLLTGKDINLVGGAIDELESYQLETLASNYTRQSVLTWVIPFLDMPPVHIRITGKPPSNKSEDLEARAWTVELEFELGSSPCSILIVLRDKDLSLSFWITSNEVCSSVRSSEAELRGSLEHFGLNLKSFNAYLGQRHRSGNLSSEERISGFRVNQHV